jgi:aryl-alcohol dehydrogenase-like predicted oxidoreductase
VSLIKHKQNNHHMLNKRRLGRTGIAVTPVGFGSQTIGGLGYGDQDWANSPPTADTYLQLGGRLIDTARGYGVSEIYVGKALKRFPQATEVTVCSKSGSLHPPVTRSDMEVSRFCLQRDVIDVYYIHVPPSDFDQLRRVLDAYEQFRKEGKIRFIGISQKMLLTEADREEAMRYIELGRADVMQFPYNFARPEVAPLIAAAKQRGIGVVVRQALEGGMFTDHFRPGHRFTDKANDWRAGVDPVVMEQVLQRMEEIRQQFVKPPFQTLAQVALAYVLANPDVSATIPGAGSPAEMRDNMAVNNLPPLTASVCRQLEEAGKGLLEMMRVRTKK